MKNSSSKWQELRLRVISAFLLAVPVLIATWFGGIWFIIVAIIIALAMSYEWLGIIFPEKNTKWCLMFAVYSILPIVFICTDFLPGIILVSIISLFLSLTIWRKHLFLSVLGVFYCWVPAIAIIAIREAKAGFLIICILFIVVWGTDIAAYFCGRYFGGPKLAPRFSPKKTWSGLIGALVIVTVIVSLIIIIFANSFSWYALFIIAISVVISQAGDLFESALKRKFNVKDSSNLIPGHGGVMDRVDGLVFVIIFWFAIFILSMVTNTDNLYSYIVFELYDLCASLDKHSCMLEKEYMRMIGWTITE